MAKLKLAFAYRGKQPGDVIDVPEADVRGLVKAGLGHLDGAVPRLRLGHLPEVAQPVQDSAPARRKPSKDTPAPDAAQPAPTE
ncbi:hypothetical protein [Streptomyces sp. NPDC021020]|uniref:hypothetical protein n=1 Tax=Streptomyces sp. NPDC021020 TaxID=3365109 RepID=UPI0037BDF6FE